ncbi:PREDICTED: uncharacterized protein LOC106745443 [Dinoponera quadriceps]|uniref:Uncharacterized protein LOC106745443 n=1 Tax=Dinoponera quadriceps TaxID=609295 RepID=A0A6P3XDU5_DINQU|nr:PREDICTED: uncharacterized protein LOC106745443 [Dinoponera quadriceps]
MWKVFTLNGTYKWINICPRLVSEYNRHKHQTINMRPVDVTSAIVEKLLSTVKCNVKITTPARFKVGYTPNWTIEEFKIAKVQATNPVIYLLEDSRKYPVAGGFYEYELHRVANPYVYLVEKMLRKNGNKVYMK